MLRALPSGFVNQGLRFCAGQMKALASRFGEIASDKFTKPLLRPLGLHQVQPFARFTGPSFGAISSDSSMRYTVPPRSGQYQQEQKSIATFAGQRKFCLPEPDLDGGFGTGLCFAMPGKNLTRSPNPMADFVRDALHANRLMDAYGTRPPYQRNDYLGWINRAKRDATKQKRLNPMLDELRAGDCYMGMAWGGTRRD